MASIFVFSNSFHTRTILFKLDYLLNFKIDEIILLTENHNQKENYIFNNDIKIKLFKSIDECIAACDCIFLLKDETIPVKSINYILNKSSEYNKKCYEIQNPWEEKGADNIYKNDYENCDFDKRPVILNIALGEIAQQYCTEVLINEILAENDVEFKQFYSYATKNFLLQLNSYGILNIDISKHLDMSAYQYDIIICSIDIGENLYDVQKYIDFFRLIKSDFIILQTGIKFDKYQIAKNIIKYVCFSQLDLLIKTHYSLLDNLFVVYCYEEIEEDSLILDIESINLKKQLMFKMFSKIAYPEGITSL